MDGVWSATHGFTVYYYFSLSREGLALQRCAFVWYKLEVMGKGVCGSLFHDLNKSASWSYTCPDAWLLPFFFPDCLGFRESSISVVFFWRNNNHFSQNNMEPVQCLNPA